METLKTLRFAMPPKRSRCSRADDLFRSKLDNIIDPKHELAQLGSLIDWSGFDEAFGRFYKCAVRPALPTRLMVGLCYLKHSFDVSDERLLELWVENPYWQHFCGFEFFQHKPPCDPTSLVRYRKRIGPDGMEKLLAETVRVGLDAGAVRPSSLERINVDTTIQPKAIAHPQDSRLYHKALEVLVRQAKRAGIRLRQSYLRLAKQARLKVQRYGHARQYRRMRREIRRLKTYLGRVYRVVGRKIADDPALQQRFARLLGLVEWLLTQTKDGKGKLYSLHAPEVACFNRGKASGRYEFGAKNGIAATNCEGFVLAAKAFEGTPYDGHTLKATIEQSTSTSGVDPERIYVDRGYRGHDYEGKARVIIAGQKRGLTPTMRREQKRRNGIEAVIGHAKFDHRMDRNHLLGTIGDTVNALAAACGYNLRRILDAIRRLCVLVIMMLNAGMAKFDTWSTTTRDLRSTA